MKRVIMNEAVEQFLNFNFGIEPSIIAGVLCSLSLVIFFFVLTAEWAEQIEPIFKVLPLVVGVGLFLVCILTDSTSQDPYNNLRRVIEQNYNVSMRSYNLEKKTIAGQTVIRTKATSLGDEKDVPDSYTVYVVKIDDDWQLCKIDDDGNFIPLEPGHVISSLKE